MGEGARKGREGKKDPWGFVLIVFVCFPKNLATGLSNRIEAKQAKPVLFFGFLNEVNEQLPFLQSSVSTKTQVKAKDLLLKLFVITAF